ncbi:hypothetical protein [Saccharibacillus sp. JS10]|uniref:hypothetical protein n=1 Tax=Saccharibacillus sp. JS10 TaxID=2950552 RepID=UPI0021088CDF|nr:hypothetical protein [Saccharibacillus sp. JS10]MCQ4088736.1 hypothetical protein [Saccharibacillus sp. JS10]
MDEAKPINLNKVAPPRLVWERRTAEQPAVITHRPKEVSVQAWNFARLDHERFNQPWHERLSEIRKGKNPR